MYNISHKKNKIKIVASDYLCYLMNVINDTHEEYEIHSMWSIDLL